MKDMTNVFFADTYALIELSKGTESYRKYLSSTLITTKFNLAELYYHFLHDNNQQTADMYLKAFRKLVIPITYTSIRTAMKFKLMYKSEKLSYVDCIGYALSQEYNVPFLTGDQKFQTKENVEFAK
jgi:predicted nucleic acid-binding protein